MCVHDRSEVSTFETLIGLTSHHIPVKLEIIFEIAEQVRYVRSRSCALQFIDERLVAHFTTLMRTLFQKRSNDTKAY